jgi:hypothetical protein
MTAVRAFLDLWAALRGTVEVAAQRSWGRTRALAAGAVAALLVVGGLVAIARVDRGGSGGDMDQGGSDADAAALAAPGAGQGDLSAAGSARPVTVAQPAGSAEGAAADPAEDDGAAVAEPAPPGADVPVAVTGATTGPEPGTSVTSTSTTAPPTTATTAPPAAGGLIDALARLLGGG